MKLLIPAVMILLGFGVALVTFVLSYLHIFMDNEFFANYANYFVVGGIVVGFAGAEIYRKLRKSMVKEVANANKK